VTGDIASILQKLNATEGVKGSLLITPDGMPVSSMVGDDQDAETLAAVTSSIYLAISRSMEQLDAGEFTRYLLYTEFGRVFIIGLGNVILIVLAAREIHIPRVNVAIFQATNLIRKSGRLDI